MKKNLFVIIGRSCSGKTTTLLQTMNRLRDLNECVSFTTRKKRYDEIDGVHYYFINKESFEEKIRLGLMILQMLKMDLKRRVVFHIRQEFPLIQIER